MKDEKGRFPEIVYVQQNLMDHESLDCWPDLKDIPDGEVVAVYELKRIAKVRVMFETILTDEPVAMPEAQCRDVLSTGGEQFRCSLPHGHKGRHRSIAGSMVWTQTP